VAVERILIVDDSPYNLFVMKEILTLLDPSLILQTALNGQEALDRVLELHSL
jgi:CheY-like chemotaxis protein